MDAGGGQEGGKENGGGARDGFGRGAALRTGVDQGQACRRRESGTALDCKIGIASASQHNRKDRPIEVLKGTGTSHGVCGTAYSPRCARSTYETLKNNVKVAVMWAGRFGLIYAQKPLCC